MSSGPYLEGQAVTFLDLPPELISSICESSADWKIIFALEQVCKALKEILSDWSIWSYLVETCLNPRSFAPGICYLTRSITTYTATELRALFVRWKKVEQGWQHGDQPIFTARKWNSGQSLHECANMLVPGGRWIIFLTKDSSAIYFDLDSQALNPTTLIPSQWPNPEAGSCVRIQFSDPDIDDTSSTSGTLFRVAVTYRVEADDANRTLPLIQIWSIQSVYDATTRAESLKADKIAEFHVDRGYRHLYAYALEGDKVLLEAISDTFIEPSTYLLVDWRKANDNAQKPSCRILMMKTVMRQGRILDFDNAVILRSDMRGPLTCITYDAVPQLPLSEIHRYRHASAISEVNYGRDVAVELPGSSPTVTHCLYRTLQGYNDSGCSIKTLLVADEHGRYFVVVYSANNTKTGFPSIACLAIGNINTSVSYYGVTGRSVAVFTDGSSTLKVAVYPDMFPDVYQRLFKGQNVIQKLSEAEAFTNPQLVTVLSLDATSLGDADDDAVHAFDEGTGRLLIYNAHTPPYTILDMNV